MSDPAFIHLAVHSAFSLSEGAIHLDALIDRCVSEGMPAVAVTDTNNLFGALEFSTRAMKAGVQPVIGCTLGLMSPHGTEEHSAMPARPHPVRLYAASEGGYRNLLKIVGRAHLGAGPAEPPHTDLETLKYLSGDVLAATAGPDGAVGHLLRTGKGKEAAALTADLKAIFGDRLYMEIMRHGMDTEAETEPAFLKLALDHDIPLLASNDVYFLDKDMYEAHDALLCIAAGTYVDEDNRRRLTPEHRFKTADEMQKLFHDLPEAIENTVHFARRTAFAPEPIEPILPNFAAGKDASEADMLAQAARAGLEERLETHVFSGEEGKKEREEKSKPYFDRLTHEMKIITDMGFPGYFLIVADFIQWAKENGVPVGPGRGSGAGSVVAWALKITDLDPLRFGLLFERFLNPERVSMPDFDIDFCQEGRDRVIRYVQEKYGSDHVAQIITFGKLQARAVMRDVGRVLQQPYPVTDRLCKMIPNNPADPVTLQEAIDEEPRLREEIDRDEQTAAVVSRALKLEGLYRHASTHAAGVVIGRDPLEEMIPLYRDPRADMPVTQFNMKWVEQAGLVKFDFLGLKTLTVINKAVQLLSERGIEVDIETLPLDDEATYDLVARGETAGVFQLESSGMRAALKQLRPDKFEDIIAMVALYRPGPMDNIPAYIARKHGEEEIDYLHDWLKPVLEETYGVIIYQEQVMQIAQILAGYSLGDADLLRRAMGKKIQAEMDQQRQVFMDGAAEKGVDAGTAKTIFDLVAKFAGYGFNKSHAAAYALVAYQTAWLKANYPVEFMAAVMTLDQHNTDKLALHRKELDNLAIPLLPPDVNTSEANFSVEQVTNDGETRLGIRYGLAAIRNVGDKAMAAVVAERKESGPFKDIFDLAERVDAKCMNKRQLESLIAAGALDAIHENRAGAMAAVDMLLRHAHGVQAARADAQNSLFGTETEVENRPRMPGTKPWLPAEQLQYEREAVGFYLSAHPLEMFADMLSAHKVVSYADAMADEKYHNSEIRMAAAVENFQMRRSARTGNRFAFLQISDLSGSFEVLVFGDMLDVAADAVEDGGPLLLTVSVDKKGDEEPRLILRAVEALEEKLARQPMGLEVYVKDTGGIEALKALLAEHEGGRGFVRVALRTEGGDEVVMALPGKHKVTPMLRSAIKADPGILDAVQV